MIMVPVELRASPIHGIGVFLRAPVRKGDVIWRFDSRVDHVYSREALESLPPLAQKPIKTYGYWHKATELWILDGDQARHINHSEQPNIVVSGETIFSDYIAAMDMEIGTELTINYRTTCDYVRETGEL